jgi:hypothetical protein
MTVELLIKNISAKLASGVTVPALVSEREKAETKLLEARAALKKAKDQERAIAEQQTVVLSRKAAIQGKIRTLRPTLLSTLTELAAVAEPAKGALLKAQEPRRLLQEELNLLSETAEFLASTKAPPARMLVTLRALTEARVSESWVNSAAEVEAAGLLEKLGSVLRECDPSLKLSVQASARLTEYCKLSNEFDETARELEARLTVERNEAGRLHGKFFGPVSVTDEEYNDLETEWEKLVCLDN